jgi:four helix bundle protein
VPIEEMEVFHLFEEVSEWSWSVVIKWSPFARDTVGKQLVRAMDSVGANLVEGDGRATDPDAVRHFVIARASAREARLQIVRAGRRGLIPAAEAEFQVERLTSAAKLLNVLIRYRRNSSPRNGVRETVVAYNSGSDDPQDPWCEP